ncbi:hypothetical protein G6F65_017343 [Rhizopus arrhizus]|nr:hypothetical protein G6F65_017343 [Rhizopus arrhizus]
MKMLNAIDDAKLAEDAASDAAYAETLGVLLRVLYPVVPHITWHLWQDLGYAKELGDLLDAPWPHVDEAALIADEIELMLQVNGKLRGSIRVAAAAPKEDIEKLAASQEEVTRFLEGRPPKRVRGSGQTGQRRRLMRSSMYFAGQQTHSSRQSWLLRGACLALFMLLSACGFALRGVTPMPFDTLYVGIPDSTQFGADVRRSLRAASPNTKLVDTPKEAQAILQQVADTRTLREVSLNAQGRTRADPGHHAVDLPRNAV